MTAVDAANNAKQAGLYRKFTKGSEKDLRVGDTVFYTENGENHVGIYLGNGMVRGNNRVAYKQHGGTYDSQGRALNNANPVGDVRMTSLGHVSGYMRADDLNAAAGGKQVVSALPDDPNAKLKKAIAEGERLVRQYGLALQSGNELWQAKAKAAVDAFRLSN